MCGLSRRVAATRRVVSPHVPSPIVWIRPPSPNGTAPDRRIRTTRYHDEWISAGAAKFFLDGVIETRTAAMLAPYTNDPSSSPAVCFGRPRSTRPRSRNWIVAEFRFSLTPSATARFARLWMRTPTPRTKPHEDARHRIEHIETMRAGYSAFRQPGRDRKFSAFPCLSGRRHLRKSGRPTSARNGRNGLGVAQRAQAGGVLGFGSDWPIVTLSPWPGVQTALTRQTVEGDPPGGFLPDERISLEDVLRPILWTRRSPAVVKKQKVRWSPESWPT